MNKTIKPEVDLSGLNGSMLDLIDICRKAMFECGQVVQGQELTDKIKEAGGYMPAMAIVAEYCTIIN